MLVNIGYGLLGGDLRVALDAKRRVITSNISPFLISYKAQSGQLQRVQLVLLYWA